MISPKELQEGLAQFSGSDEIFYSAIWGNRVKYTLGIKYLLVNAGAYWLFDEIAGAYLSTEKIRDDRITFWTLKVYPDRRALLTCEHDSEGPTYFSKVIEYTDFPLDEIKLFLAEGEQGHVLMLPGEY